MVKNNGWDFLCSAQALSSQDHNINSKHPRLAQLYDFLANNNNPEKEYYVPVIREVWISPDEGMYAVLCDPREATSLLTPRIIFIYTGFVAYTKKTKAISETAKNQKTLEKFMKEVLSQTHVSEPITFAKGWDIVPDKNGYPRAMTVLYKDFHLYKRCPKIWYQGNQNTQYYWSKKIRVSDPRVIMRRNAKNEMVEMGCFMPWKIENLYNNREWCFYKPEHISNRNLDEAEEIYKKHPEEFGVYVYQLSAKGKQMYDEFKANGSNMSKFDDLWKKYATPVVIEEIEPF